MYQIQHSKKNRYLLLSETLLGFPKARKRTRKVSEWLGNPKRVSDSNKYRIFFRVNSNSRVGFHWIWLELDMDLTGFGLEKFANLCKYIHK